MIWSNFVDVKLTTFDVKSIAFMTQLCMSRHWNKCEMKHSSVLSNFLVNIFVHSIHKTFCPLYVTQNYFSLLCTKHFFFFFLTKKMLYPIKMEDFIFFLVIL